jgi:biofilm PGA synthesis N-glycosyltransferase PgaC
MKDTSYVLVTPARNEEEFIGRTIEAVLSQTILPRKWIIVSDGSTDRTDEIVTQYAQKHSFIHLILARESRRTVEKDFGSKVRAFRAGYDQLEGTSYTFVGNLDADITFDGNYHERLLERFYANSKLGLAGGIVLEPHKNRFVPQRISLNSVCGSVQFFRRECYESFGGYIPIRTGGVDAAAEIMARMHGWEVRTFPDITVFAQRAVSTGGSTILHTRFRQGMSNYLLGYHPIFQVASSLWRMAERPYGIAAISMMMGYSWAWVRRYERAMPVNVIRFLRSEQIARLRGSVFRRTVSEGA